MRAGPPAAELAAADESGSAVDSTEHRPRFSAVICTLPDSAKAARLRTLTIALQVRGEALLEWCGMQDDCQTAIALFQPKSAAQAALGRPDCRGIVPVRHSGGLDPPGDPGRKRRANPDRRPADRQPRRCDGPHAADARDMGRNALGSWAWNGSA